MPKRDVNLPTKLVKFSLFITIFHLYFYLFIKLPYFHGEIKVFINYSPAVKTEISVTSFTFQENTKFCYVLVLIHSITFLDPKTWG